MSDKLLLRINKLVEKGYTQKEIEMELKLPQTLEEAKIKKYNFWKEQNVPSFDEFIYKDAVIGKLEAKDLTEKLPKNFQWNAIETTDIEQINAVSEFLNTNYSDENDNFSLSYSSNFLYWALNGAKGSIAITITKNNVIYGFIGGIITDMQVNENVIKMLDVDFLCVSPKLRNCGMAQTLIKEITRRSTILGIEQATFTSSRLVPKPVTEVHYYHRPLNFKKLLEIGFCHLDKSKDVEHVNKLYSLPDNSEEQFIEMMPEHLDMVFDLFNEYNDRYNFYPKYSKDEFSYWILNSNVRAYVYVENNVVKDFISYYILPSKIKNDSNRNINCAYLYYYSSVNLTIYKLFTNLMVEAKNNNIDVINLTTIMENKLILEACNCVEGTGSMFYYLYNYKIPDLRSNQIAKITL